MKSKTQKPPEELVLQLLKQYELVISEDTAFIILEHEHKDKFVLSLHEQRLLDWICLEIYNKHAIIVKEQQLAAALSIIRSQARIHGQRRDVHIRFACHNGSYYLDLCSGKNQIIKIDDSGWEIVPGPDILFYRPRNLEAIPTPERTGKPVWDLFRFINVSDELDMINLLAWITSLIRVDMQRPILTLTGPPGSSKTTCARLIRSLFDPASPLEVDVPAKDDEFALAFFHNQVPLFDNVSKMNRSTSDMFCKAVTGGAFSKRALYTDLDMVQVRYRRPIITTSLEVPSDMPDYHRRMLHIELGQIPHIQRRSERELMQAFEQERAELLASLLSLTCSALKVLDSIQVQGSSSMVDFDVWGAAVSHALGHDPNVFLRSRVHVNYDWDHADDKWTHVAEVIERFAQSNPEWEGTMSQLYNEISKLKDIRARWPRNATGLGKIRSKVNLMLSEKGIQVVPSRRKSNENHYKFTIEANSTASSYCEVSVSSTSGNIEDQVIVPDNRVLLGLPEVKDTEVNELEAHKKDVINNFKIALEYVYNNMLIN